jgi:mRNA interferase RelE/StbE
MTARRYRAHLERKAQRELLEFSKGIIQRIASVIDDMEENPRPPGAKKLKGQEGYRIRQGDYRLLYAIDDKEHIVRIYRIGHRREIYRGI